MRRLSILIVCVLALSAGTPPSEAGKGPPKFRRGPALIEALLAEGARLIEAGEHEQALPILERCLARARRVRPADDHLVARTLMPLGSALRGVGRIADAAKTLEELLAFTRKIGLDEELEIGLARGILAKDYQDLERYEDAAAQYERAIRILESAAPDHPEVPGLLNRLANCHVALGRLDVAISAFERAAVRGGAIGTPPGELAMFLENLGLCLRDSARYAEGLARAREALALRESAADENPAGLVSSLRAVATCLQGLGRPADALPLHRRAMSVVRDRQLGDDDRAGALNDLATCLADLGRSEEALKHYEESVACRRRLVESEGETLSLAASIGNLAHCLSGLGRHDEADARNVEACGMFRRLGGEDSFDTLLSRLNLATSRLGADRAAEALPELRELVPRLEKMFPGGHPLSMWARNNLAECLVRLERLEESVPHYRAGIEIARQFGSPESHYLAANFGYLLLLGLKKPAEALPWLEQAVAGVEERRSQARGLGEWDRAAYFSHLKRAGPYEAMIRALLDLGRPDEAVAYLERGRARSLRDLLERSRFDALTEAERRAELRGDERTVAEIRETRSKLARLTGETSRLSHALAALAADTTRDETERRGEALELSARLEAARGVRRDLLQRRSTLLRDVLPIAAPATPGGLREKLRKGERMLLYSVTDWDAMLLVVPPPGGETKGFRLAWSGDDAVTAATLSEAVDGYLASLRHAGRRARGLGLPESGPPGDRSQGARLFRALVPAAVWKEIAGLDRVYLVPHEALHRLPFETLVVEEGEGDRTYWLDAGPPIAYAPSGSVLDWCRTRRDDQGDDAPEFSVVALGDPVFRTEEETEAPPPPEEGALVTDVPPDTAAARAGLRPGDVIRSYEGKPIDDTKALLRAIRDTEDRIEEEERPDGPVSIGVWRRGREVMLTAEAGRLGVYVAREAPPVAMKQLLEGARARVVERGEVLDRFGGLVPLPGTRAEVLSIYRTVAGKEIDDPEAANGPVRALLGAEATKGRLFELAPRARFLHLATHQLVDETDQASYSRLALTLPRIPTKEDDGFLTLLDLLERWRDRLSACEMVVLSACETQRGHEQRDEGVVAMPVGFLYAGAPTVVASLWRVDDRSTAKLMAGFYERLHATKRPGKLDAFTAARRELRKTHPEPWFWAPFVYIGDPR